MKVLSVQNDLSEIANGVVRGTLKPRNELKEILYKFIFPSPNKTALITTNWDTVIDSTINELVKLDDLNNAVVKCVHLHGSIKEPEIIYLPSEVVREPYRLMLEHDKLSELHNIAAMAINFCNKVILYGLSIDPLDAELSHTLSIGFASSNLEEIIVINPDHKNVANRVKLLLTRRKPIKIIGVDPTNLNQTIEY